MSSSVTNNRVQDVPVNNTDAKVKISSSAPSTTQEKLLELEITFDHFVAGRPLSERDIQILDKYQHIETNKFFKYCPYVLDFIKGIFLMVFPIIMSEHFPFEIVITATVAIAISVFGMIARYCNNVRAEQRLKITLEREKIGRKLIKTYDELARNLIIYHIYYVSVPLSLLKDGYSMKDLRRAGYEYNEQYEIDNYGIEIRNAVISISKKKMENKKFLLDKKIPEEFVEELDKLLHDFEEVLLSEKMMMTTNRFYQFFEVQNDIFVKTRIEQIKRSAHAEILACPPSPDESPLLIRSPRFIAGGSPYATTQVVSIRHEYKNGAHEHNSFIDEEDVQSRT